ncbi:TPA: hypothetical protein ACJGX5_003845 [Salmonella enterica subsp. enterica serovar Senftenberg]
MKGSINSFFEVRIQIFSDEAASQLSTLFKSDEFDFTPAEMFDAHSLVMMFLENSDKLGVLMLCIAEAVSVLKKPEEVAISYVKSDGTPVSFSLKSPDALRYAKEIIAELEKNPVQNIMMDIAGSPDNLKKD